MMNNSITKLAKLQDFLSNEELKRKNPKFSSSKSTTSHVFEKKTETYVKYNVEKHYERAAYVD